MLDKQNLVIVHSKDKSMCGQLRAHALTQLGACGMTGEFEFVVSPEVIRDEYLLKHTCTVFINRVMGPNSSEFVKYYGRIKKKYGFRIVVDYDDVIWDVDGRSLIPEYNCVKFDPRIAGEWIESCVQYIDEVTFSTRFLGQCWIRRFGEATVPFLTVLPNFLPRMFYGRRHRRITRKIAKPKVVYGGSITHFKDHGNAGDFGGPWIPWLQKAVSDDAVELHMFGYEVKADFLQPIKDKIVLHQPAPACAWGSALRDVEGDIYLAPLLENDFNRAKSNLKLLEASATGMAFLGSWWEGSCPYEFAHGLSRIGTDATPEDISDAVSKMCEAKAFNEIMEHQKQLADRFWLEDPMNLTQLMAVLCRGRVRVG